MDKTVLYTGILLGFIGYALADCLTTPCLYGGTCLPRATGYKCSCQTGFSGDMCEKPDTKEGMCPLANSEQMLRALLRERNSCRADCAFDFECPDAMKCCLIPACMMQCTAPINTDSTPCEQERELMDRTRATFQDFAGIRDITFRQYISTVQNNTSFNNILGSSLSSVSLAQALQMFGDEPLGNIFTSVITAVPFPDPKCTGDGAYLQEQCTKFLTGDPGTCRPITTIFKCLKTPISGDAKRYKDIVTGRVVTCQNRYDESTCSCAAAIVVPVWNPDCDNPSVDLPFDAEFGLREKAWRAWIKNSGVGLVNRPGATGGMCAYFNGRASLRIPLFSGAGWGGHVYVKIRYQEDTGGVRFDPEALFSNAACEGNAGVFIEPSVVIAHDPAASLVVGHVNSGGRTDFSAPANRGAWKIVTLAFDASVPALQLTVDGSVTSHVAFPGTIKMMSCPAGIGVSNKFANFKGCIDYIQIYRCIP